MLTETALKHLKPKDAIYKVADRDGMYVTVSVVGTISFRFDYRLNVIVRRIPVLTSATRTC